MKKQDKELKEEKCCCNEENETCNCDNGCCCENSNTEEKLQEASKVIEEYKNKLLYKEAEFVNFRRRKEEEVASLLRYANQDLILEIIKSVDNFERAIESIKKDEEKDNTKILTGVEMIYQELKSTLKKFGVEEISDTNVPFDEKVHHAVMTDSVEDKEDGIILEVMIKGYKLLDRVIRPAMVKVNQI